MDKKIFRKKAKEVLSSLNSDDVLDKSIKLSEKLAQKISHLNLKNPVIGGFSPIQKEAHWFLSSQFELLNLSVPHILEEYKMEYYQVNLDALKDGSLGLELDDKFKSNSIVPDLILVPGLLFDKNMCRLGRGKGFYDRYLKGFNGLKIGICFECQLITSVPTNEHDIEVDMLITEENIYMKGK